MQKEATMEYLKALTAIDTEKTLKHLKLEYTVKGSYLQFTCPCGGQASVKRFGHKKNLFFCQGCKGGHIIQLAMKVKNKEYEECKKDLLRLSPTQKILTEPLQMSYELQYHKKLEELGITEEFCKTLGVGVPKGKTMLAGHITFSIHNNGILVAYYGINLKTGTPKFHRSFNPECYLYAPNTGSNAVFTTNPIECLKLLQDDVDAVHNFNLPYLSPRQIELLNQYEKVEFRTNEKQIMADAVHHLTCYYRFAGEENGKDSESS